MSPEDDSIFKREYMCRPDPPLPPYLTDEELDFMSMAIPLKELVKGLGGHEVPYDVVTLAHYCIDGGYGDDVIDRLRQIYAVTGSKEGRMQHALQQVVHYGVEAFRKLGDLQSAAELQERNITHPRDLDTQLGRLKVDYRSYEGHYAEGAASAVYAALKALHDILAT
jgi:hypothetical protein